MAIFNYIKNVNAKLIFSSDFHTKYQKKFFDLKIFLLTHIHPSLLPKYKGLRPVREALKITRESWELLCII